METPSLRDEGFYWAILLAALIGLPIGAYFALH